MERDKDEKTSVWTDLLIILVLFKFVLQHVPSSLLGPLLILVFTVFLGLRSRFVHSVMRHGLSLAAVGVFLIDISYSLGPGAATLFLVGLVFLFLFYFVMRRFLGFFFR